jgi:hypothetical protein
MKEAGIVGTGEKLKGESWKKFVRRHRGMTGLIVGGIAAATVVSLLVFIPMVVLIYLLWYRKLPADERKEYEGGPKRSRSAGEDSGFSFFVGIVWLAIVWLDGNWNRAFEQWSFNDWVYSWLAAALVVLVIVGIPAIGWLVWTLSKNGE